MSVREQLRFRFNDDPYGGTDIRLWTVDVDKITGEGKNALITLNNYDHTKTRTMTLEELLQYDCGNSGDRKRIQELVLGEQK